MSSATERRKQPRRKSFLTQEELQLHPQDGRAEAVSAKLLDVSDWGLSIECRMPIEVGSAIRISGKINSGFQKRALENTRYRVCWIMPAAQSAYRLGVTAEPDNPAGSAAGEGAGDEVEDYYDMLQLSPKADTDTLHRVFRILAQRYHPDNQETGNEELFRQVMEAYRVLSDPQRRAAYDARLESSRQLRFRIFQGWQSSRGAEAERRKRQGVLAALYSKRLAEPREPTLSVRDLEEMVSCPREHLEFTLWYLKEAGYITRTDNARYSITVRGVDLSESMEQVKTPVTSLLGLPAPASGV